MDFHSGFLFGGPAETTLSGRRSLPTKEGKSAVTVRRGRVRIGTDVTPRSWEGVPCRGVDQRVVSRTVRERQVPDWVIQRIPSEQAKAG